MHSEQRVRGKATISLPLIGGALLGGALLGVLFAVATGALAERPEASRGAPTPGDAQAMVEPPTQGTRDESLRQTPVVQAVQRVAPAVVAITTENPVNDPFARYWGQPSTSSSEGSGVVIAADGLVLTNAHVVSRASRIQATFNDGRGFEADILGLAEDLDLAVLRLRGASGLTAVEIGSSSELLLGEPVIAIGNPFGLGHTVTTGVISATRRALQTEQRVYQDFLQTDASINPGNSGGPLFDLNGKVIGINTAIVPGGTGIGFAVPIDMVKSSLDELKQSGRVARGWIGVGLRELDDDLKAQLGAQQGVVVSAVYPDQPAAKAGLSPGDVITGVDGKPTGKAEEVIRAIGLKKPGEEVKLEALSDGKARTFKVVLGERPEEEAVASGRFSAPSPSSKAPMADGLSRYGLQVEERGGALVVRGVSPTGPARGRLQEGDVILQVNRQKVSRVADLGRALGAAEKGAMLVVQREGAQLLVSLPAPG